MFSTTDFESLSQLDRSLINYILNNLEKVSLMRVRDLAHENHVSATTIMRFVKRHGFESFIDFKFNVKQELSKRDAMRDNLSTFEVNRYVSFDKSTSNKIDALVSRILDSTVIYCTGLGSSGIMAEYFQRLISDLGYMVIASKDGYLPMLWNSNLQDSKNLIIFFSSSGETRELLKIGTFLKDKEIYVVSLTNGSENSLSHMSDLNISYEIPKDRVGYHISMTSQIPTAFLIEIIARKLHVHRIKNQDKPI